MDGERIESLIGIPPLRLRELEAAERKLAAVREVVKKARDNLLGNNTVTLYKIEKALEQT